MNADEPQDPAFAERILYWEYELQKSVLQPFLATKRRQAFNRSRLTPENAAIEHQAFDNAALSLMGNMLASMAMDLSGGKASTAARMATKMMKVCEGITLEFLERSALGIAPEHVAVERFKNGKPVPFDFRNHLKPATSKPDSGRASPDGVGGA